MSLKAACIGVVAIALSGVRVGSSQAAELQTFLSFSGIAEDAGLGYAIGDLVTFTFELNQGFVDTGESTFTNDFQNWLVTSVDGIDNPVFSAIAGTGLSGTYTAGTPDFYSVSSLSNGSSGLIGANVQNADGLGLSANGNELSRIYLEVSVFADDIDFAFPGAYTPPGVYFAGYAGSYTIDPDSPFSVFTLVSADSSTTVNFTPTAVTIVAVPEPQIAPLLIVATVGGILFGWARRRAAGPHSLIRSAS